MAARLRLVCRVPPLARSLGSPGVLPGTLLATQRGLTLKPASPLPSCLLLRVGCFSHLPHVDRNTWALGREVNCSRTAPWSGRGVCVRARVAPRDVGWRGSSCARARGPGLEVRSAHRTGRVVGPAGAGRGTTKNLPFERNYNPSMKVVGWQCPGCGLCPVGHPQAKKKKKRERERDRSLSRRWWRSLAAVEGGDPQVSMEASCGRDRMFYFLDTVSQYLYTA
ncbi:uncharacterized protein LOC107180898 [Panthera tigris]|uniref:uncharacterized protein LOC107180898 n=1 Tax=Panthera tigris TaxID=9694 RepID=UPI001C6F71FD|nr:uncharacterized protein LOC107180898 [Panthera tigris]